MTSCSLDVPIEDEITGLDAIDNVAVANETLSGIYRAYPKDKILFSVLADDFYPNRNISNNKSEYDFYRWQPNEIIIFSTSLWQDYYNTIAKANVLLNRIDLIATANQKEAQQLKFIKSQTLCLKALSYFDLLQLYAPTYSEANKNSNGIILKDDIASEELPRADMETSYKATESLLLEAIELAPTQINTEFRFSINSAKALLAKVYFNWKKYDKAIALCNELINAVSLSEDTYASVWKSPENNPETVLVFENKTFNYTSIFDADTQKFQFYINRTIGYDDADYRKQINLIESDFILLNNTVIKVNFLGKVQSDLITGGEKPILAIRTAELYFIKAESLFKLSDEDEAKNTINMFLSYRNAMPITSIGNDFLTDLLKEKQKEFLGEGLRYFDIKRNKIQLPRVNFSTNTLIKTIATDDYRWLLPIPLNEIKQNKNVVQNPNWETFI